MRAVFVPRDFSADTVLLKTEELGKKALAQSAIFRQIHERLLPLLISSSLSWWIAVPWPIVVPCC